MHYEDIKAWTADEVGDEPMNGAKADDGHDAVSVARRKLWGCAGGELEYVSQRIEWRERPQSKSGWEPVMIIRFTDHDVQASPGREGLIDGKFYEFEFPVHS